MPKPRTISLTISLSPLPFMFYFHLVLQVHQLQVHQFLPPFTAKEMFGFPVLLKQYNLLLIEIKKDKQTGKGQKVSTIFPSNYYFRVFFFSYLICPWRIQE